jgi:hypothetical protein
MIINTIQKYNDGSVLVVGHRRISYETDDEVILNALYCLLW